MRDVEKRLLAHPSHQRQAGEREQPGNGGVGAHGAQRGPGKPARDRAEHVGEPARRGEQRHAAHHLRERHHLRLQPRRCRTLEGADGAGQERHQEKEIEQPLAGRARQHGDATREDGEQRRGGQHDPPPAVPIRDVAAVEHQRDARDRLGQAEPAEVERVVGQLIDLEAEQHRHRRRREPLQGIRGEKGAELLVAQQVEHHGDGQGRKLTLGVASGPYHVWRRGCLSNPACTSVVEGGATGGV